MSGSVYNQGNPMLLPPGAPQAQQAVPALSAITKPYPIQKLEGLHYYTCTMKSHSMHRGDGKKLAFVHNILVSDDAYDVDYMENELLAGNPFISRSTSEEINMYNMLMDPKGTMAKELRPEMEAEIRGELEASLRAEMLAKMGSLGIELSDEQKAKLAEDFTATSPNSDRRQDGTQTVDYRGVNKQPDNLAGIDALNKLKAGGIPSGTGTVFGTGAVPTLGGIQGTDKMASGATDSNSASK